MLETYFDDLTARDWQESAESDGPIRIACIGAGFWGENEAIPAMEEGNLCEPSVVVDADEAKLARVAEEWDLVSLTPDEFHEGAHADVYDAVYVATPNRTHLAYVEAAAGLGKDILCEKPLEISSERAERLIDACDAAGVTLMVGYRMQTDPIVRRAKELIQDGFVGELQLVHGHMSDPLLELIPDPDQWRLDPETAGGCSLIDIGVYPTNTTRFILETDPHTVNARVVTEHDAFSEVDERITFDLEFPDGVMAVCSASHNGYQASHLKFAGTDGEITLEPIFFPPETRKLRVARSGTTAEVAFDQVSQMVEEFDYFADCLLSGREPYPNGPHGLTDIRIVEAAYEDVETNPGTPIPGGS